MHLLPACLEEWLGKFSLIFTIANKIQWKKFLSQGVGIQVCMCDNIMKIQARVAGKTKYCSFAKKKQVGLTILNLYFKMPRGINLSFENFDFNAIFRGFSI